MKMQKLEITYDGSEMVLTILAWTWMKNSGVWVATVVDDGLADGVGVGGSNNTHDERFNPFLIDHCSITPL